MLKSPMRIIHCTQKLLKELKVTPVPAPDIPPAKGLGNWYANLLRFNRRKCILFTNEKSMYTFLVPNVVKADLKDFPLFFFTHLSLNLQYEGFSRTRTNNLRDEYKELAFAKTNSRRVLGFMNDFAFQCEVHIQAVEGVENMRLMEINSKVNRTPCDAGSKDSFRPIEVMRDMMAALG